MKNQRIHACQEYHYVLYPKVEVTVEPHWLTIEQQKSGDGYFRPYWRE